MKQELLTVTEKYEYEISTKEEIVKKLEIQYRRYTYAFWLYSALAIV